MKMSGARAKWRWLLESTASEIAEAAIILPLLFMLMFAIYSFGRAFSIYSTINHAARQAVLTAASPTCASCGGSGFPSDPVVTSVVSEVLTAANLDPAKLQAPKLSPAVCPYLPPPDPPCSTASSGKGGGQLTICRNVALDAPDQKSPQSPQACGMIVSFQYPYTFVLPFTSLNRQLVNLPAQAQAVGEN